MDLKLIHQSTFKPNKYSCEKHKLIFSCGKHDCEYVALYWDGIDPIVYDAEYDDLLSMYSWNFSKAQKKVVSFSNHNAIMHRLLFPGQFLSHITNNYCDNRKINLTTVREFNSKKKNLPPEDLIRHGIPVLPKYLAWRYGKFVIEGHPALKISNQRQLICSCNMPTMYERYMHAVQVLNTLSEPYEKLKRELNAEYDEIVEFVKIMMLFE